MGASVCLIRDPCWSDEEVNRFDLAGLQRIDLALEGAWSETVVTVWTAKDGLIGFSQTPPGSPSLELYFEDIWIHCYQRVGHKTHFDQSYAQAIIDWVERKLNELSQIE